MAYTKPTPTEFKARYPAFASVDGSLIQWVLDNEVPLYLGDNWPSQAYFTQGAMLYTAHALTLEGFGTGSEATAAGKGLLNYQSIRSGALSLTRFNRDGSQKSSSLSLTSYGNRYLELVSMLFGGPVVAAGGAVPVDAWNPPIDGEN